MNRDGITCWGHSFGPILDTKTKGIDFNSKKKITKACKEIKIEQEVIHEIKVEQEVIHEIKIEQEVIHEII